MTKEYLGKQTVASLIRRINAEFKKYAKLDTLNDRIPVPTQSDDGKFLRVVDGKWSPVELTDVSEVGQ